MYSDVRILSFRILVFTFVAAYRTTSVETWPPLLGAICSTKWSLYGAGKAVCGHAFLGRALGQFIFSLIGLQRILFTNIFQKL